MIITPASVSTATGKKNTYADLSQLSRPEKEQILLALEEKQRRARAAPLLGYRPHSKQILFHEAGVTNRIRLLLGANKSGKTWAGTSEALAHSYGYYYWKVPGIQLDPQTGDLPTRETIPPEYWVRRGDGLPIQVPNVGMVVTGLARERGIGQVISPVVDALLPPSVRSHADYRLIKGPQGVATGMRLPNGSEWIYASADQDALTFEGTRLHWSWCDEPVQPYIFNGLWRGLIVDVGPIWFSLTPLGAKAAWMWQKWVKNPPPGVSVVKMQQSENPSLTPEAIEEFSSTGEWTDAERRARLFGDFESLGNRVIHNFDPDIHVIKAKALPASWRKYQAVDPHHARPPAVLWAKKDPLSRLFHIIGEYPAGDFIKMKSGGKTPTQLAIEFRNIEGREPAQVRLCDPRFGKAESSVHGKRQSSWVDLMAEAGLSYDARIPNIARVESGEQRIVDMLRYDKNYPISPTNTPRLLIHDCCPNLIAAMENYGILPERDPTKGEPEKRSEEFKDFIDALRYLVLFEEPPDIDELPGAFSTAELAEANSEGSWHDL